MAAVLAKMLTETDLGNGLQVPADWQPLLPAFGQGQTDEIMITQLWVTDGIGYFWEFWYYRIDYGSQLRSHILHAEEWLKFVFRKGLKVGDRIVLDKEEDKFRGTKYTLRAQRLDSDSVHWLDV